MKMAILHGGRWALMGHLALMVLMTAAGVQGCRTSQPNVALVAQPSPTADTHGQLGPGDIFEIRVYGEEDLSGLYRVSPDGSINFPLLGRLHVTGLSADGLNDLVTERLKKYLKEPHVSTYVKEYNSQKIYVFGEVRKPGTFSFEPGMNIIQAITLAGGFDKLADENGTYITRRVEGREEKIEVRVDDIGQGLASNEFLRPGDIVYVPESMF